MDILIAHHQLTHLLNTLRATLAHIHDHITSLYALAWGGPPHPLG